MATKSTPPDNKMRLVALDQFDDRVLYIEGTITSGSIADASTVVIALRDNVVVDEQGGCISLTCNTEDTDYHVAWLEYDETYTYGQVAYCKSPDGGETWGTPVVIDIAPTEDDEFFSVRIMGDSAGRLFLLYQFYDDSEAGGNVYTVKLWCSLDTGSSWDLIQTFTYADAYCDIQIDSNDNIYVFYWSDDSGNHVCRKSIDKGNTFGDEVTVVASPLSDNFKAELDDSDNIHVIYERGSFYRDAYHTKSVDGAETFSTPVQLAASWHIMGFPGQVPWFTITGDDIYFVWVDDNYSGVGDHKLIFSHSPDSGETWLNTEPHPCVPFSGTPGFGHDLEPNEQGSQCLLYDGATLLYLFGGNHATGWNRLTSFTSDDGGNTWTESTIIEYGKTNHWHPSLATYFTGVPVGIMRTYFILA